MNGTRDTLKLNENDNPCILNHFNFPCMALSHRDGFNRRGTGMVTLHLGLEIDFNEESQLSNEQDVLKSLHTVLDSFVKGKWICDYKLKGGEIDGQV